MRVPFVTVDVFTRTRFRGNPLAVVVDARGLSGERMQRIAAEFNYSESTFVLPPRDPGHVAEVRIFTPNAELPFAGHPNVGTAFALGRLEWLFDRPVPEQLCFEEKAGLVTCVLQRDGGEVSGATIQAPRPLEVIRPVDRETIAGCASLGLGDLAAGWEPVTASVGLPYALAEVVSLEALGRAAPNAAAFAAADRRYPHEDDRFALFLFVRLGESALRARMFAPLSDTPEDPATGSASAALAAMLAWLRPDADFAGPLVIEQGVEMGRPSTISLRVEKVGGSVRAVHLTGDCVEVMSGTLVVD